MTSLSYMGNFIEAMVCMAVSCDPPICRDRWRCRLALSHKTEKIRILVARGSEPGFYDLDLVPGLGGEHHSARNNSAWLTPGDSSRDKARMAPFSNASIILLLKILQDLGQTLRTRPL